MIAPIKVGFVGLSKQGWASILLAPTLLKNGKYSLTAVSTSSPESSQASAEKQSEEAGHPVTPYYGSTSKIAADPNVDFVAVSVRSPNHYDALIPVLDAGKDFFIEWPAGRNTKETLEFAEKAHAKGLRSMVGLQGRHSAVVKKVKEIIDSGRIGNILSTSLVGLVPREMGYWGLRINKANAATTFDPSAGSSMLDIAIGHHLDILTYIFGDLSYLSASAAILYPTAEVVDVEGNVLETAANTAADHISFIGAFKSGVLVSEVWRGGVAATQGRQQLLWEIDGEEGSIRLTDDQMSSAFVNIRDPKLYLNGELVEVESAGLMGNLAAGWAEFAKGKEGTHATIDDALKIHQVIDAIALSAKEGRKVTL
ncbi:NAD-binding Rossmann fold oxidoreductase [Guyanagaster necrorhizus]|uniref:NAD-binding Rossmann fold oxidoreductase n=1 Tax=Guyanagaster necrorhizus TaxID=856835 RepID=A0A9P7VQ52_9AGAR|nr:NAD-binding Rossmann fold oxidoreductase [Guyanagaster necrorhizus MCA 3950]KAG7443996.1 NAD-binding Rossmann fold oxidoreductase [Guyanagaster necrorhizus MCA 3950]